MFRSVRHLRQRQYIDTSAPDQESICAPWTRRKSLVLSRWLRARSPGSSTLRQELAERYTALRFNDTNRTLAGDELIAFLRGATKAITGLDVLDDAVFRAVPELRVVSKYGVGLDMIDLRRRAASRRQRALDAGREPSGGRRTDDRRS